MKIFYLLQEKLSNDTNSRGYNSEPVTIWKTWYPCVQWSIWLILLSFAK